MNYDPVAASQLPKDTMPELQVWIESIEKFGELIRSKVKNEVAAGCLDPDDAEEFETFANVESPVDESAFGDLCVGLPCQIPASLSQFFLNGSAGIRFKFAYDLGDSAEGFSSWIRGGETHSNPDPILSISKLPEYLSAARNYATKERFGDYPEEYEIWQRSIPIFRFNNSDFVALDPVANSDDPLVIHLDHEGEPNLLAPNLASFLVQWRRICFVGPGDYYDLGPFMDEQTGAISGDTPAAVLLRKLLGWNV